MFIKGKRNLRVGKHYHVICNCLKKCLRDLLYNMLLMFMLIYRLLLIISFVAINKKGFKISAYKDLAQFITNLATYILWFLRLKTFL
jgi:hypothetical protein